MKNSYRTIIIYSVTVFTLIITGLLWWQWDIQRIKSLGYQARGQLLSQYRQVNPNFLLSEIKEYVQGRFMYIIDEYPIDSTAYEIIGYSRRSWISSGFIKKVTIVGEPHFDLRAATETPVSVTVYGIPMAGGALPFFSIAVFALLAVAGLMHNKKNLPHLFEDDNARDEVVNVETEG